MIPIELSLANTQTRKKEVLKPLEPGHIRMYSCGPTVYGLIHIGNLRAALTSDMFFRWFQKAGYKVTYVRNYTDVDDKIIQKVIAEKTTLDALTKKYIQEVERDFAFAGMLEPTHKTLVTTHMPEIISMIEKIIENKKAYVVEGDVYYSVVDFKEYGKLSGKNVQELFDHESQQHRVEVDPRKKNPMDFALWKSAKAGEPSWDSPWGKGRPGWHIECSAMATKWLGPSMDVHHGGEDLVFPHHENEIAQSEGATGKAFSQVWMHNAFLNLSGVKMSKSLGNVMGARDFLAKFGAEVTRYLLLSVHYRTLIDFNEHALEQAMANLQRLYEAKKTAVEMLSIKAAMPHPTAESEWGQFCASAQQTQNEMQAAFANDLATPEALASLFKLTRELNRLATDAKMRSTPSAVLGAQAYIQLLEDDLGAVIGIGRQSPEKVLADLARIKKERAAESGTAVPTEDEINSLIQERLDARKNKNFARADEIRKDLDARGVLIKDSPTGTTWQFK